MAEFCGTELELSSRWQIFTWLRQWHSFVVASWFPFILGYEVDLQVTRETHLTCLGLVILRQKYHPTNAAASRDPRGRRVASISGLTIHTRM